MQDTQIYRSLNSSNLGKVRSRSLSSQSSALNSKRIKTLVVYLRSKGLVNNLRSKGLVLYHRNKGLVHNLRSHNPRVGKMINLRSHNLKESLVHNLRSLNPRVGLTNNLRSHRLKESLELNIRSHPKVSFKLKNPQPRVSSALHSTKNKKIKN